jgi:TP901 family phage tail tape measure protein
MARTREELRDLVAVLKELKATSNLGIDADLDRLNKAISKVGKGDTGGFRDIIEAAQDMKRILREALDIDPQGIYKVNTAIGKTIESTRELARAEEAYQKLVGQEKNQLRYLQSAPVPASIQRQQAEQADIQRVRNEVYTPQREGETVPYSVQRQARKDMNAEFERRAEPFLTEIERRAAIQREVSAQDKEMESKLQTAADALQQSMNDEAAAHRQAAEAERSRINSIQQGLLQQEIDKRTGEIAAGKADQARLRKLGEEAYANPNQVNVGIDRSSYNAQQAADATQKGEEAARQKEIAEKETVADLEQQKLLQQEITRILEQQADEKLQPELSRYIEQRKAELAPPQINPQAAALNAFGGNQDKLDSFSKKIGDLGFKMKDLTSFSKDAASGITTMSGSITNASGVTETLTVHVDRFGNVVQSSSNNFKSFGDVLFNNTKKMLEWVVAGGLIFGAISKLKEVFGNMAELQTLLNDITITSGQTGEALQSTFDSVVDIANTVGVSAVDSLKAMNYALKIAGDSSTDLERTAKATQLLASALTLAKLGGIDVNEAMDTLVAALEQSGTEFEDANKLLSSFQAIAKTTGGSIDDLATTFGITAGAAKDVGISIDELNGIIGAFAAVTTKSAEETGNALKVMFSNYQSDKAQATLQQFGISVRNFTTGEARPFIEVMDEVSAKVKAGIISDADQSRIANANGGGGRRAADFTALIGAWDKVAGGVDTSAEAFKRGTDAADALQIKQGTLESAVKRLNNAFLGLSNSLGDKGGFVEIMTSGVNAITSMIDGVNSLTNFLGPLTSAFAALIALNIGNKLFGNQIGEAVGKLRGAFNPSNFGAGSLGAAVARGGGQIPEMVDAGESASRGFVSGVKNFFGSGFVGAAAPAVGIALMQAAQGQGAQALASGVAGLFMAGVTKSAGWASIGAALASIIVTEIMDLQENQRKSTEAETAGIQTFQEYKKLNPNATAEDWQKLMMSRIQDLASSTTFGNRATQLGTGLDSSQIAQIAVKQYQVLQSSQPELLAKYFDLKAGKGVTDRDAANAELISINKQLNDTLRGAGVGLTQAPGYRGGASNELVLTADNLNKVSLISKGLSEVLKDLTEVTQETVNAENTKLASQKAFTEAFGNEGTFKTNQLRNNLLLQMGQPGSSVNSPTEYRRLLEQGQTSTTVVPQILSARHPEVQLKEQASKFSDEYNELFNVLARAGEERANFISQVASEINNLNGQIQDGKAKDIAATKEQIVYLQKLLDVNIQLASVESAKSQIVYPGFEDKRELSKKEVLKASQSASRLQDYTVREMGIDPELFQKSLDDIYVMTKDGLIKIKGLSKDFFSPAIDGIKEMKKQMEDSFNFQNLRDYPIDVSNRLQKAMNYYQNLLKQWGLNEKIEKFTFLFKDNQVAQLVGSQTALQLALQDLTAVEKKQLDGIYNLPSGATAFIPLQAGQMLANNTANNNLGPAPYDYGNLPTPPLTPLQNPLDQIAYNTSATNRILAEGFTTSKNPQANNGKSPPYAPDKEPWYMKYAIPKADRSYDDIENVRAGRNPSVPKSTDAFAQIFTNITQTVQSVFNAIRGLSNLQKSAGLDSAFRSASANNQNSAIRVEVKPEKVTNEFSSNVVLRLDGRVVATVVKKYLFEDYQRLTASVGRNSRSSTGVI